MIVRHAGDALVADLKYAFRALARAPMFSVSIVIMLSLGVGVNSSLFSIVDRLLVRAPPELGSPAELARIEVTDRRAPREVRRTRASYPELLQYRAVVNAFSEVGGYSMPRRVLVDGADKPAERSVVTSSYFRTLGATPHVGRFADSTDVGGPAVAVLAFHFWHRQFGKVNPIGLVLRLDGVPYTVVGVARPGFTGAEVDAADVWTLADHGGLVNSDWRTARGVFEFESIVRLAPRASRGAADAQASQAIRALLGGMSDDAGNVRVHLTALAPGNRVLRTDATMRIVVAVSVVALLLLALAAVNVTSLLALRMASKRQEFVLRRILGQSRLGALRMQVTEVALLALASALGATAMSWLTTPFARFLLLPSYTWATRGAGLSSSVVAGVATVAVAATVGGLVALRGQFQCEPSRGTGRSRRLPTRGSETLIGFQAAVSVLLLVIAGLFARSIQLAKAERLGMQFERLTIVPLNPGGDRAAQDAFVASVRSALEAIPEIESTTVATSAPLYRLAFTESQSGRGHAVASMTSAVADDYFRVTGVAIAEGRRFNSADAIGTERITIVDQTLAATEWPGQTGLGQCLAAGPRGECLRVVGIAAPVRLMGLIDADPQPQYYVPLTQSREAQQEFVVFARARVANTGVTERVWRAVEKLVPGYPRSSVMSYDRILEGQRRPWVLGSLIVGFVAVVALFLCAVGVFATAASAVRRRKVELAIRAALGAQRREILYVVLHGVIRAVLAGCTVGMAGAMLVGEHFEQVLYRVQATDVTAIGVALIAIAGSTCIAALLAALPILYAEPARTLREGQGESCP